MECPLCFENYNDLLKKPRNLECGHTFCEICLSKLFSNNFIICPACRRQSSSPPKSLPVNFIAADLARKYLEEKKKYQFCETHSKEIIRFFCNTCSSRICIECIVDHCGHLFVKQEESIRLLQLKINEIDCQISKNIDKNNEVIFEVKEISHSLDKKLLKEFQSIDYEFNLLAEELKRRKNKIKDLYREMIENEKRHILEGLSKIEERDKQLKIEKEKLRENLLAINALKDSDSLVKTYNQLVIEIKDSVEEITSDQLPNMLPPMLTPSFEMTKNAFELISNIGAISCTGGRDSDINDHTICFFGDKNKVMAYNILENS